MGLVQVRFSFSTRFSFLTVFRRFCLLSLVKSRLFIQFLFHHQRLKKSQVSHPFSAHHLPVSLSVPWLLFFIFSMKRETPQDVSLFSYKEVRIGRSDDFPSTLMIFMNEKLIYTTEWLTSSYSLREMMTFLLLSTVSSNATFPEACCD